MKGRIAKIIIIVLAFEITAAVGWWLVYGRIQKINSGMLFIKKEIADSDLKQKNIRRLDQILQDIDAERKKIKSVFVTEAEVVGFIENLEETARLSGAELEIQSASLPTKAEEGGPVFSLNLSGSFSRVFKFFELLEKMKFQIKLEDVRANKNDKENMWEAQIRFKLLSYK